MYIISQRRNKITNIDNAGCIRLSGKCIVADKDNILATYQNDERAHRVFSELLKQLFLPEAFILENMDIPDALNKYNFIMAATTADNKPRIDVIEPRVYYMSEE